MDESNQSAPRKRGRRRADPHTGADDMPTVTRRAAMAPVEAASAPDAGAMAAPARQDMPATNAETDTQAEPLIPRAPRTRATLLQRTPGGGYVIGESTIVSSIRAWGRRGAREHVRTLCE